MRSALYLQSVLVEHKILFGVAINAVQLSSAFFSKSFIWKVMVMKENRTNRILLSKDRILLPCMIRVFLENLENPFFP